MDSLVQNINKTYAQWSKVKREFQLTVTKSQANPLSKDSAVEKRLVGIMQRGDELYGQLRSCEEKYVLNQIINQDEQMKAASVMTDLVSLAKGGQKTKLFRWALIALTCGTCARVLV